VTVPANWTPPPRSLLYATPVPPEEGGGIDFGCDCGTVTRIVIEGAERLTGPAEMSFTCDCLSVHWFTVRPDGTPAPGARL
jgi:hypothetical protein